MKFYYRLWFPETAALTLFFLALFFKLDISHYDYKFIFSCSICFVSITTGSLITMTSMIMTNTNLSYLKVIKDIDPDDLVTYYLTIPIVTGVILSLLCIFGAIMIDYNKQITTSDVLFTSRIYYNCIYITCFLLMLADYFIHSAARAVYLITTIFKSIIETELNNKTDNFDKMLNRLDGMINE